MLSVSTYAVVLFFLKILTFFKQLCTHSGLPSSCLSLQIVSNGTNISAVPDIISYYYGPSVAKATRWMYAGRCRGCSSVLWEIGQIVSRR